MKPLLRRSDLSGQVFIITNYTIKDGILIARRKHDVTEDFNILASQRKRKRTPAPGAERETYCADNACYRLPPHVVGMIAACIHSPRSVAHAAPGAESGREK